MADAGKRMRIFFLIPFLLLASCASDSGTTRFTHRDASGATTTLEFPKELTAENLDVEIVGLARVKAKRITTTNIGTIQSQGKREAANIKATSDLVGKSVEGAVTGGIKGLKGGLP